MGNTRSNPEYILKEIQKEHNGSKRGHLKIFFGYAAGVGKTYSMLQAAHQAKENGVDVVVGYIEPHGRPKTAALLDGLEALDTIEVEYKGMKLKEFDIDAAIERKPQLILVDELAHTNANGCRHKKRYQDIEELLKLGINVYTTINVQHIESLNDMVAQITKILVRERIPDSVFDDASQVELVDIEPQELIKRLNDGDVYNQTQAKRAVANFFTIENLTALREIALRRCADRVNKINESNRIKANDSYHTDEHILVCLSSSPSNPKIIRTAARMASAFKGTFTALYVETQDSISMDEDNLKRLRSNMRLAEQLGAKIETVYGDDVPFQIAEYARLSGVSKVVIGRSSATKSHVWSKPSLTEKLILNAPNLDIHIIPDRNSNFIAYRFKKMSERNFIFSLSDIVKSVFILFISSVIGVIFYNLDFADANIITVYVLGVLITAVVTKHQIYSLASSIVSVLVFNFLFTYPRFSFHAYDKGYPMTFIIMFIAAFITGSLAVRLKNHAKQSAQSAYRTKVLFDTNQLLQQAVDTNAIIEATSNQLVKLLDRSIIFYKRENDKLSKAHVYKSPNQEFNDSYLSKSERAVVDWVFNNNKHAGATTETLSNAKCLYLAVRVVDRVYGVVGIVIDDRPLESFENSILLSIIGECALAMENRKNACEKEEAAVLAKNEQLRANLLRAISHDLRTPLTSISGDASNLLSNGGSFDEETKRQLYSDIYDDSMWLINLVENLLAVTRIEEGKMNLRISNDLVEDVIEEALNHVNRMSVEHNISVENEDDLLMAKMDARLIVQVIINIVDNAIKYTAKGSNILIRTKRQGNHAVISIADDGEGISDENKERIFDMFYSGANKVVDSRRSLGLGLSLCKNIINAHGGTIKVTDNEPHGTIFTFTLPIGEVKIHE